MRTGAQSVPFGRLENTKYKMSHQNTGEKPDRPIESETVADGFNVRWKTETEMIGSHLKKLHANEQRNSI